MKVRAVYVTDTTANVRMLEGLGRDLELTVLAPAALGDRATTFWPPKPGANIDRVLLPGGRLGFALRAAWWIVRHRRAYAVTIALDNMLAALAANAARIAGGPPVVLQVGRPAIEYIRCQRRVRPWWSYIPRIVCARLLIEVNERLAAGIGAVSEYVARQCARRNRNAHAIPWYGVDTVFFAPPESRRRARAALGLPEDGALVLYRSRLAPEKDPETFLGAVAALRAEGRTVNAVYMGGEWEEMRAVAARLGVDVIAQDTRSRDDLPRWYAAADVNVQTSHAEGLGLSPLEAMACGTPVVVTDTGGLPEVVDGGRYGALVPAGDAGATARAIARLLDEPSIAEDLVRRGRAFVEERFAEADALEAWVDLIHGAARPSRARRRVLFVDHESRLSGGQRDLVDLVRALDPAVVEVHAALPEEGPLAAALRQHGATVHLVPMSRALRKVSRWDLDRRPGVALRQALAAVAASVRLVRVARRLRPDIVHSNSLKAHVLASPAARLSGARNVWHVRDILEGRLRTLWRILAGILSDRVVCLSEAAAVPFRRGRTAPKVRVVYNGIRPSDPDPGEVEAWRTRLGANGGSLVGIVGQLAYWKGQDVFVEASARIAARRPDVRFAVVGSCLFPENENGFVEGVRQRAEELGLDGNLTWVGQAEPVEPVLAAFDVFVHASRLPEPFGRVIVEAMALGKPVVASALGAGPEIVTADVGRLVQPGDPEALATAVEELLGDERLRAEMGVAARRVAQRFDIARTGAGVMEVYEELVG